MNCRHRWRCDVVSRRTSPSRHQTTSCTIWHDFPWTCRRACHLRGTMLAVADCRRCRGRLPVRCVAAGTTRSGLGTSRDFGRATAEAAGHGDRCAGPAVHRRHDGPHPGFLRDGRVPPRLADAGDRARQAVRVGLCPRRQPAGGRHALFPRAGLHAEGATPRTAHASAASRGAVRASSIS